MRSLVNAISYIDTNGKMLSIPLRFLLHERRIGPGIPIQYYTTDPLVKPAMMFPLPLVESPSRFRSIIVD